MYNSQSISEIHKKYDYMGNQVLDIYEAPFFADNDGNLGGEALGFGGKDKSLAVDEYFSYISEKTKGSPWGMKHGFPTLLNHEIGHMLNLNHTWNEDDGCDDTPKGTIYQRKDNPADTTATATCHDDNANCWANGTFPKDHCKGTPNPCCDTACWPNISNNIMDYNAAWPSSSYTPCQIDKMAQDLKESGGTYIKTCQTNCPPPNAFFWMLDNYDICNTVKPNISFAGVAVNEDNYSIMVTEKGKLPVTILSGNGQVGNYNLANSYKFQAGKSYNITLRVDNSKCKCMDQYSKSINFKPCDIIDYPPIYEIVVKNPIENTIYVNVDIAKKGKIQFRLVHQLTSKVEILLKENSIETPDRYFYDFDVSHLQPGNYILQTIFDGVVFSNNISKIE